MRMRDGIKANGNRWLAAAVLPFMLTLVMPLSFYFGNRSEYLFSIWDIVWELIFLFVVMSVIGYALLSFLGRMTRGEATASLTLVALAIGAWVQGQWMVWDFGPLDGRGIDWNRWRIHRWAELGVWAVGWVAVLTVGRERPEKTTWAMGGFGLLVGSLTIISTAVTAPEPIVQSSGQTRANVLHPKNNHFLFVLDTFQSDVFDEIRTSFPDDVSALQGFTFYRNAVGGYPTTYPSIPLILTGKYYRNEMPIKQYIQNAYNEHSIAMRLKKKKVGQTYISNVGLQLYDGLQQFRAEVRSGLDVLNAQGRKLRRPALRVLEAGLFRASPIVLKAQIYRRGIWLLSGVLWRTQLPPAGHGNDVAFMGWLGANIRVASSNSAEFRMYHLVGAHMPIVLDEKGQYNPNAYPNRENYLRHSRGALSLITKFLSRLKDVGLYENAEILIVGDHGTMWILPDHIDWNSNSNCDLEGRRHASALPLFLYKSAGQDGKLKIDDRPIALSETPCFISIVEELYDCEMISQETADRVRHFFYYQWGGAYWKAKYLPEMREYTIRGHAYDCDAWSKTDRVYRKDSVDGEAKMPRIELGETYGLTKNANADRFVGSGWSGAGVQMRWTDGEKARLRAAILRPVKSSLLLRLDASAYLAGGLLPHQEVDVTVNGNYVGSWKVRDRDWYEVRIPAENIKDGKIEIAFNIRHPAAPCEVGDSLDCRRLGIAARQFQIVALPQ